MKNFLVTIKGHSKRHYSKLELDIEWTYLRAMTDGLEWTEFAAYEEDKIGRMHLHTTCKGKKAPYFKKLQKPGWSLHFKEYPTEDYKRVQKYLIKHNQSPNGIQQLFFENEIKWAGYMFPMDQQDGLLGPAGYEAIGNGDPTQVGCGVEDTLACLTPEASVPPSELDHGVAIKIKTYKELFSQ